MLKQKKKKERIHCGWRNNNKKNTEWNRKKAFGMLYVDCKTTRSFPEAFLVIGVDWRNLLWNQLYVRAPEIWLKILIRISLFLSLSFGLFFSYSLSQLCSFDCFLCVSMLCCRAHDRKIPLKITIILRSQIESFFLALLTNWFSLSFGSSRLFSHS